MPLNKKMINFGKFLFLQILLLFGHIAVLCT